MGIFKRNPQILYPELKWRIFTLNYFREITLDVSNNLIIKNHSLHNHCLHCRSLNLESAQPGSPSCTRPLITVNSSLNLSIKSPSPLTKIKLDF